MYLKRYCHLLILLPLLASAHWFMDHEEWVEMFYTKGVYPYVSGWLRFLFGWLPFSIGDLFYITIILFMFISLLRFLKAFKGLDNKIKLTWRALWRTVVVTCWIWLCFQVMWGFNYARKGIVSQFALDDVRPDTAMIRSFAAYSLQELNRFAPAREGGSFKTALSKRSTAAYAALSVHHPDIRYERVSFKASLFGVIGNYMGYGGYYNPFSGEAQFNDQLPEFLLPFIAVHEIAHQLGYAKESDANFIGYLAAVHSHDSTLLYAAHLEFFLYANAALKRFDSLTAKMHLEQLPRAARNDLDEYKEFTDRYQGRIDAMVTWFYSRFLRFNRQPEGMASYNKGMVFAMMYMHKKNRLGPVF